MKEEVIAIFDIGKTNKKLLLFDLSLRVVLEEEERFSQIHDEEGFECDNFDAIEKWIWNKVSDLLVSDIYHLIAVNFTTYGATLVYLDGNGKKLTPVYNYLKPVDESIPSSLYTRYGGRDEFSRRTASPALGMLNSGIQALWLKRNRPELFQKVRTILHLPQYLAYTLSGELSSEHTSIGCHTGLWDFDSKNYHPWVIDEKMPFPDPISVKTLFRSTIRGRSFMVGTGLHDSSASLAPYFTGNAGNFILMSTGTWCITMNPFNSETLTGEQLSRDCLCYMDINGNPVKSSRLFLGHMHDTALGNMSSYFRMHEKSFRLVKPESRLLAKLMEKFADEKVFTVTTDKGAALKEEPDLFVFDNFIEAYHLLMVELSDLTVESVNLVIPEKDITSSIFITGGFSKNLLFRKMLSSSFPFKNVMTSEISNSTALGAAAVTLSALYPDMEINPGLGLNETKI